MMDPKELIRKIANNATSLPETDWAGRRNVSRSEIEDAINRSYAPPPLSKKQQRQIAREERRGRGVERG